MSSDLHNPSLKMMMSSAIFYGVCSGSMNFVNKLVLNTWMFTQPGVILAFQLVFLIVTLHVLKFFGKIDLVSYNRTTASSCWLLSALYSANTCLALFALSGMNVPMYAAMRRCIPMASAVLGFFVFGKKPSFPISVSIILITIGAVVAAAGDLQFDMTSYILGSISALSMASHLAALQYNGTIKHMTSLDLLYVNSINCVPIVVFMSLATWKDLQTYPYYSEVGFLLSFLLVVLSGALLNYSMFLCTTVNSALTTSCVGVLKSGFAAMIGMFVFGGVTPTPLLMIGLLINFFGGVLFVYSKYQQTLSQELPTTVQKLKCCRSSL